MRSRASSKSVRQYYTLASIPPLLVGMYTLLLLSSSLQYRLIHGHLFSSRKLLLDHGQDDDLQG
jgi:hypothetical protein